MVVSQYYNRQNAQSLTTFLCNFTKPKKRIKIIVSRETFTDCEKFNKLCEMFNVIVKILTIGGQGGAYQLVYKYTSIQKHCEKFNNRTTVQV